MVVGKKRFCRSFLRSWCDLFARNLVFSDLVVISKVTDVENELFSCRSYTSRPGGGPGEREKSVTVICEAPQGAVGARAQVFVE